MITRDGCNRIVLDTYTVGENDFKKKKLSTITTAKNMALL